MIDALHDRAAALRQAREFFFTRGVVELDTFLLQPTACVDAHIDLIRCDLGSEHAYLHSSPEYELKKWLSLGVGDCYQLSHVFRKGERGELHRPEFTMVEWYRLGFSFQEMIDETVRFLTEIAGERHIRQLTYRTLFQESLGLDPFHASEQELLDALPSDLHHEELVAEGRDGILNLLLGTQVEPSMDPSYYTVVTHFPASQCALAKVADHEGDKAAERFEVYTAGVELANGYHELTDPIEQLTRLEEANRKRKELGKEQLPIDQQFIAALERGLPECCGVAVGFDRLLMVRRKERSLAPVIPEVPTA